MGDRCSITLLYRRQDAWAVAKCLSNYFKDANNLLDQSEEEADRPGVMRVEECEANYAWYEELSELATYRIPFEYWHGEGGNYDAQEGVAFDGEHFAGISTSLNGLQIGVGWDPDLEQAVPDQKDLDNAQRFFETQRKARALMDGGGS